MTPVQEKIANEVRRLGFGTPSALRHEGSVIVATGSQGGQVDDLHVTITVTDAERRSSANFDRLVKMKVEHARQTAAQVMAQAA